MDIIKEYLIAHGPTYDYDEQDLFRDLVSSEEEDLKWVIDNQKQIKSVCGGMIEEGQLSFQCFSCAPDPHHMFCERCFIQEKHRDHKVIMRHNIGGCCDCGDIGTISEDGFCENHLGFTNVNVEAEINKIPKPLQDKIIHYIKTAADFYLSLVQKLPALAENMDLLIVDLYSITKRHNYTLMIETIESHMPKIQEYQNIVQAALWANQSLYRQIQWLSENSMPMVMLITNFLMQENPVSYFEQLMSYQVHIENCGDAYPFKLESMIYVFHANQTFKLFSQGIYLKIYNKLMNFRKENQSNYRQVITKFIIDLRRLSDSQREQFGTNQVQQNNYNGLLEKYLDDETRQTLMDFKKSTFHEHHTQYISPKFQNSLFSDPNIQNIFSQLKILQQNQIDTKGNNPYYTINTLSIFLLRFEYNFFLDIALKQLSDSIGINQFEKLSNTQISHNDLINFPYQKFIITALMDTVFQIKPASLIDTDQPSDADLTAVLYQLITECRFLSTMKSGLSWFLNTQTVNQQFQHNLIHILLYQSFSNIKQYRNQVEDQLVNITPEIRKNPQFYLNLYKNASLCDKFFTLYLTYEYLMQGPVQGFHFKALLIDLLKTNEDELYRFFEQILSRTIARIIAMEALPRGNSYNIYVGQNDFTENESQEAYDLAFIKLFLYLYGSDVIPLIIQEIAKYQLKTSKDILNSILLKLLVSDQDLFNITAKLFQNDLPNDLQNCLRKIVSNQFIKGTYLNFKDIKLQLQVIPLSTKTNLEQQILQICEVDPFVRQLKLKSGQQVTYEPQIFQYIQGLQGQMVEALLDKKEQTINVHFGNGIEYDVKELQKGQQSLIRSSIQRIVYTLNRIEQLCAQLAISETKNIKQLLQLLYNNHKYLNLTRKAEDMQQTNQLVEQTINDAIDQATSEEVKQYLKSFQDDLRVKLPEPKLQQKNPAAQQKLLQMKQKYANKMTQFQQNEVYDKITDKKDDEEEVCQSCKISIKDSDESCIPILIQKTNIHKYFKLLTEEDQQTLVGDAFNYLNTTISNCRHIYHKSCLDKIFEGRNIIDGELPIWLLLSCPICKQSLNLTLPLVATNRAQVVDFENWLLNISEDFNLDKLQSDEQVNNDERLAILYLQLFVDLICKLQYDTLEFIKQGRGLILKSLLLLFRSSFTTKKLPILPKEFENIKQQQTLIGKVSAILAEIIMNPQQVIQAEWLNQIVEQANIVNKNQIKYQLALAFNIIPTEIPDDQLSIVPIAQFKLDAVQQLKSKLKTTFQDFYNTYFIKGCSLCSFYVPYKRVKLEEMYLCLLCFKQFCQMQCKLQNLSTGNLNNHAIECHSGNSIYISLQTHHVALISSPISILHYKSLFYNPLGQKIDILNSLEKWDTYKLDEANLAQIVEVIVTNSQKWIIRNLETKNEYINRQAMY